MLDRRTDLNEQIRQNVTSLLAKRVADGIDLMQQAKQAHWNVKGLYFTSLHKFFDELHEEVETSVDLMAERIMQLGGSVYGTYSFVAENSSLPPYPAEFEVEDSHINAILNSLETFGKSMREAIRLSVKWDDAVTADICTQIARAVDKNLWILDNVKSYKDDKPNELHKSFTEDGYVSAINS